MILHGYACDALNCNGDDCTCGADEWESHAKSETLWNALVLKSGHAPAWVWKLHDVPLDPSASCGSCHKPVTDCACVDPV